MNYGSNLKTNQVTGFYVVSQSKLNPSKINSDRGKYNKIFKRTLDFSSCAQKVVARTYHYGNADIGRTFNVAQGSVVAPLIYTLF